MKHKITKVRPVLLSAPYASEDNMEVLLHLPHGYRTCGMVEITLDNGLAGLGEGYLAVFAPVVFEEIVRLLTEYMEGRYIDEHQQIMADLQVVTGYWSNQGAARHVLSAIDIALYDLLARLEDQPLYRYLNPDASPYLDLYASGGDSINEAGMSRELDEVQQLGIRYFKIRARKHQVDKTNWCIRHAKYRGIAVAVDMTQNLVTPGQTVEEVIAFRKALYDLPYFLEEPLGPARLHEYPILRNRIDCRIAGGEIITTPSEINGYMEKGYYDIAQPDATVIGGISALRDIFGCAGKTDIYVHCWGGSVGMAANYHAAAAFGGSMAEWPLPCFQLRKQMIAGVYLVENGKLKLPDTPGLGITLTDEVRKEFPFDPKAIYNCLPKVKPDNNCQWKD